MPSNHSCLQTDEYLTQCKSVVFFISYSALFCSLSIQYHYDDLWFHLLSRIFFFLVCCATFLLKANSDTCYSNPLGTIAKFIS